MEESKNTEIVAPKTPKPLSIKIEPTGKFYKDQKWLITIAGKKLPIGTYGLNDMTLYGNINDQAKYLARHEPMEMRKDSVKRGKIIKHPQMWTPEDGLYTRAFWSRFLTWGDSSDIFENIKTIESMLGVPIKYTAASIKKHINKLKKAQRLHQQDGLEN